MFRKIIDKIVTKRKRIQKSPYAPLATPVRRPPPPPPPTPWKSIKEEALRKQHPALQEAWDKYQMLLKLYDTSSIQPGVSGDGRSCR